jgi:hypothetical protein
VGYFGIELHMHSNAPSLSLYKLPFPQMLQKPLLEIQVLRIDAREASKKLVGSKKPKICLRSTKLMDSGS